MAGSAELGGGERAFSISWHLRSRLADRAGELQP